VREAVVLPGLLLTASLVASVRVGEDGALRFVGPTLFALVLAVGLAAVLARAGVVTPIRLIGPARGSLPNANGAVVLVALVFAAAQLFTALMPESGLMAALFGVFYVALLGSLAAARPQGARLVRSLGVVFGAALLLRFVVLDGLTAPGGGLARRLFATALDGLTLGALGLEHHGPATGYAVFVALVLFFVALLLLPGDERSWAPIAGAPDTEDRAAPS
jgi:hypothetical protein